MPEWKQYQEEVASFFRSLGLEAETDVTVEGTRTKHAIDVLVKARRVGFDVVWVVECKYWKDPVSKLHVLGLRQIVNDIGADRGILLCEVGFQRGAVEASVLSNVHLSSLADVRNRTRQELCAARIGELYERFATARYQYWEIPKGVRIAMGLRQEIAYWYSGSAVLQFADDLLAKSLRGIYPISDVMMPGPDGPSVPTFSSAEEVIEILDPMMCDLEKRLQACFDIRDRWREIEHQRS
ncbi:restriction endonuclease [Variovorax gossypii]|uniref:Restriction endonuclease n=1 Tax=Variovorax gossypii TaxID=1679495 RepID=A0A431TPP1_9BURK|nr:restriction endonuclease [Variovorax gossypii]